jgi:hypothetical protein
MRPRLMSCMLEGTCPVAAASKRKNPSAMLSVLNGSPHTRLDTLRLALDVSVCCRQIATREDHGRNESVPRWPPLNHMEFSQL